MILEAIKDNLLKVGITDNSNQVFQNGNGMYIDASYVHIEKIKIQNDLYVHYNEYQNEYILKITLLVSGYPSIFNHIEISSKHKELLEFCLFKIVKDEDLILKDFEKNFPELIM